MTLLHQAAQKAVEAKQREAFEHWYSDAGRWPKSVARGEDGHYLLAQTNSSYEAWRAAVAALQQQPEPVALKDGVPNTEAAIAYSLDRWGYRQGTKECIAFYRGACWLQLATPPALQHQEVPREPVAWIPYLADRADGVRGHYAISRWNPGTRGYGYRETWNLRSHKWTTCSDEVLTLDQANELLRGLTIPSAPTVMQQEVPSDKQIARAFADEQMRQGSGTHNRHEWFRRGALWAASPSTTRQQEVGIFDKTGERINAMAKEAGFHMEPMTNMLYTVRGNHAQLVNFARLVLAAAPSTPEKAGGVPAFDPTQPCLMQSHTLIGPAPTMTYCQRCKNPHHACDGGVPSPIPHPLPAQANDGGEHG